jgi:hypothetical protein
MKKNLLENLSYDPLSGNLHWIISPRAGITSGSVAGSIGSHGYVTIKFKGKTYRAHQLIWELHYGCCATGEIDHKNRIKHDNRIDNLRIASDRQNKANRKVRSDSMSGKKGVRKSRTHGKWIARIRVDGLDRHIGTFDTPEKAASAYMAELKKLHGEFAFG